MGTLFYSPHLYPPPYTTTTARKSAPFEYDPILYYMHNPDLLFVACAGNTPFDRVNNN